MGYIARVVASRQSPDWTLGPFIVNNILLLVAPALFAASIYMLLGRIILLTKGEQHSIVKRDWLTKIFVGGDVLSFLMQSSGEQFVKCVQCFAADLSRRRNHGR